MRPEFHGLWGALAASGVSVLCLVAPAAAQKAAGAAPIVSADYRARALASALTTSIGCGQAGIAAAMEARGREAAASDGDLGAALALVADAPGLCEPVRAGARRVLSTLARRSREEMAFGYVESSAGADTMPDADIRAASLRFEAGPPPANLTRNRISAP